MHLGGAHFHHSSDYSQLYIVDGANPAIEGIADISEETLSRRFRVAPNGVVVYTADCLRQVIRIAFSDSAPEVNLVEVLSEDRWTKVVETEVSFASGTFTLSSPSRAGTEAYGPHFKAVAPKMKLRISWLEYDEDRYNAFRAKPDVICLQFWPATSLCAA